MKTSNKLLIGFTGLLVLLMLCTDIVLRANFSKGITNVHFNIDYKPQVKEHLPAFKVVQVVSAAGTIPLRDTTTNTEVSNDGKAVRKETTTYPVNFLNINHSDSFSITKSTGDSLMTRTSGDTLTILVYKPGNINISCPGVETVLCNAYNVRISDMKVPVLRVITGPSTEAYFYNNQIGSFHFSGGTQSSLDMDDNNHIDSLQIRLEKASKLKFSAEYKQGSFEVDSLKEINFSGKNLPPLKQIK